MSNDSMLEMYLFETTTLLDQLDSILLESEENEKLSSENINEIFRIMHTIKGSSAMMEFDTISHTAHKVEDLFYFVRDNGVEDQYFDDLMDLVLKVSDFLKVEIDKIHSNQPLSSENNELIEQIEDLLAIMESNQKVPDKDQKKEQKEEKAEKDIPEGNQVYYLHVHFDADSKMENVRAFMLINKLETIGKVLASVPDDPSNNKDAASYIAQNGFYVSLSSSLSKEEVLEIAKGTLSVNSVRFVDKLPEEEVEEETVVETKQKEQATDTTATAAANGRQAKQNLISVDLNKLDTLMDLVGEIVITESMVIKSPDLEGLELENFNKSARQLRKLTDELQDIVMSIRMIPISSTFQKMRRLVRDLNKKLSRNVELVLLGETTEVDKTIIDAIVDPLMHLVRNAMDHGIESAEERIAANKDPAGQIVLSAQNAGGDIIISVSDDGRGLDPDLILEKAKSKNLLTKPENEYSHKEILNLIMMPGFSTKETVSEYSGRGVGMDVVKKNIEKIGGTVTIESIKGQGTNILFKIPLTLAIIPSMLIRVGKEIYCIPISNIRESFKPAAKEVFSDPDNNEMIMIRGACYPIIRLYELYKIEDACQNIEDGILMLVDTGERLACIFVDELLGEHQVVVKPMPYYLSQFRITSSLGISGCTILGDGSISLILDVAGILNNY
ncbi:MAG: chemotaxis protein CheA [Clostridiales bacterium]|nr:chemotaxis protein CheA [Clostridiales bacterium]